MAISVDSLRGWSMRGRNYRQPKGQAYTRGKYIHGAPPSKISKFMMGDTKSNFEYRFSLVVQSPVQIRHNALEAARVAANKVLFDVLGETGYKIHLRVYPHIVLRENRMIATAGADRLQEGMRRSFGKPSGRAARMKSGQSILDVYVNTNAIETAKKALRVGSTKLPVACVVSQEKLITQAPQAAA
jgi:large subunit ribosomal protein L10e